MTESFDLEAYFKRIGYSGPRDASVATLRRVMERHPKAIPFENLDPLTGKVPSLVLADIEAKIMGAGRGGYCFEHNGLFEGALTALGFDLTPLAGRVIWGMPPDAPIRPRTHKFLKIETEEGPLVADVGFGGFVMTAPLALEADRPQDTGQGVFRLVRHGADWRLEAQTREGFLPQYQFSEEAQRPSDYQMANWFVATHPNSPFISNLMCARVEDELRLGLQNRELALRYHDGRVEKQTLGHDLLMRILVERLGLPEAAVLAAEPHLQSLPD